MINEHLSEQAGGGILFADLSPASDPFEIIGEGELCPSNRYICEVRIVEEQDGGYAAYAPQLPGAHSQGESDEEATQNIREAIGALIESYLDSKEEIPWIDRSEVQPRQEGEMAKWVTVDA